ncbi:MAG: hypothetical protein ACK44D_04005 [Bacteroidia bacterium]
MNYTGNEDHSISLAEASELTANYRNAQTDDYIKAEYFGKNAVLDLLDQDACVGMRIYYGQDTSGVKKLVLVGVDGSGDDLVSGVILEYGIPCPTSCSASNTLNS